MMYGGGFIPQTTVYLTDEIYRLVSKEAHKERTSVSQIARRLIQKGLGDGKT